MSNHYKNILAGSRHNSERKKENEKKEKKEEADNKSKCSKVRPMAILEENYEFKHCTL